MEGEASFPPPGCRVYYLLPLLLLRLIEASTQEGPWLGSLCTDSQLADGHLSASFPGH